MAFLIGIAALSIGTLLLLTQAEEPKQDRKVIHLTEVTCKTFTELTREEQNITNPPAAGESANMTDEQIMQQIRQLDAQVAAELGQASIDAVLGEMEPTDRGRQLRRLL